MFSVNDDSSSQVIYMIFQTSKYNKATLIDYRNIKSRRVERAVLCPETFSLADA